MDDGDSWWYRGDRLDDAAHPGFGYSGLVDLGAAAATAGQRLLGVVYEAVGKVVFKIVTVDYSGLL